jgi:hypothetical protein
MARAKKNGHNPNAMDCLIAAIALANGMVVASLKPQGFREAGCGVGGVLGLQELCALLDVVPHAKKLDILHRIRGPSLRIRKDVVEVKILLGATQSAHTHISLPNCQFHM